MSSVHNGSVTPSLQTWTPSISFSCLAVVARTSSTMLNGSGENQHPCCVPEFSGAAFSFSLLSIMLAVGLFLLCSLCTQFGESFFFFYQKWMLNFIKCLFCAHWDDHVVFGFFILLIYAFPFFDSYSSQDGLSCAALMNSSQLSVVLLHKDLLVAHATVGLCMAPLRGPDEGSVVSQLLRQKSNIASSVLALKTASRKWHMWLWFILH